MAEVYLTVNYNSVIPYSCLKAIFIMKNSYIIVSSNLLLYYLIRRVKSKVKEPSNLVSSIPPDLKSKRRLRLF